MSSQPQGKAQAQIAKRKEAGTATLALQGTKRELQLRLECTLEGLRSALRARGVGTPAGAYNSDPAAHVP